MSKKRRPMPRPRPLVIKIDCRGKTDEEIAKELVGHVRGRFLLTPRVARSLLEVSKGRNPRGIKQNLIDYVAAMKRGNWEYNGDPIRFLENSIVMVDGQHRCKAVIISGVSIEQNFITDIQESALDKIDRGRSRCFADTLYRLKKKNTTTFQAATALVWRYESGKTLAKPRMPEDAVLMPVFEKYESYFNAAVPYMNALKKEGLPTSITVGTYAIFAGIDPAEAERFYCILKEHTFTARSPIKYLDTYLRAQYIAKKTSKAFDSAEAMLAHVIIAWNYYRQNIYRKPAWRRKDKDEPFPKAI
jgi:hypothetical protein